MRNQIVFGLTLVIGFIILALITPHLIAGEFLTDEQVKEEIEKTTQCFRNSDGILECNPIIIEDGELPKPPFDGLPEPLDSTETSTNPYA